MALDFVHPAFLWGGLLAAVPIVIHLINRRRTRRIEFAAIALVLKSRERNARKLRLRRLLLLLSRTLLCLAVPLALARPFLAPRHLAAATPTSGPTAVAIVLDTSMSMRYLMGGETLFERGKQKALSVIGSLDPEDTVAVLPCADKWMGSLPAASYDLADARGAVRAAKVTYRPTDMGACLSAATRVLSSSPLAGKRLVIITDLTASGWHLDSPPPTVTTEKGDVRPEIDLLDVTDGRPMPNRWVGALTVEPALALGPRGYAFSFDVRASGGVDGSNLSTSLEAGGKVLSRGFVDLSKNGTARKTLSHAFAHGGEVSGRVTITKDALPADDARAFTLLVKRNVRALVVDGEPSVDRYADEVFFVERALQPGRGSGSAIEPTVVDTDGFATADLGAFDLVLLLNVRDIPEAKIAPLVDFVKHGGGLFISAGDNLDPDAYNRELGELLPARLHVIKAADGGATALAAVRWGHPIFSVFVGSGREGFASARFSHYLLTRPPPKGTTILATYEDGAPALLYRPFGQGRVALYTSTVDRAWTDLPIRTAFLPLMQQISGFLARALDERRETEVRVGGRRTIRVPSGATELMVVSPSGRRTGFKGAALEGGTVDYDHTQRPGLYSVSVRRTGGQLKPAGDLAFVVVPDPHESDTTRIDPKELLAHLGATASETTPALTASIGGGGPAGKRPLWTWLILAAVLALVAEGWLLRKS